MASASSSRSTSSPAASVTQARRPRPRSPPSMYVAYDSKTAKPPKPLIKIEKKSKGKSKAEPDPPHLPARSNSERPATDSTQRRPSVGSFLSLRRKASDMTVSSSASARDDFSRTKVQPVPLPPLPHSVGLHEANIHPFEELDPEPIFSRPGPSKASRLLGASLISRPSAADTSLASRRGPTIITSDLSTYTWRHKAGSSSTFDLASLSDDAPSIVDTSSFNDEQEPFADDAHLARESMLISPMEFAASSRPASLAPRALAQVPPAPLALSFNDEHEPFADDAHLERESMLISPMEFAASSQPTSTQAPLALAGAAADDSTSVSDVTGPSTPVFSPEQPLDGDPQEEYRLSYASVHDYYRAASSATESPKSHSPQPSAGDNEKQQMQYRPDSPFLDTLVAVNSISQILVSRAQRRGHAQAPSVVRVEPNSKERGTGWVGEWNQEDMHDVLHKLRTLR